MEPQIDQEWMHIRITAPSGVLVDINRICVPGTYGPVMSGTVTSVSRTLKAVEDGAAAVDLQGLAKNASLEVDRATVFMIITRCLKDAVELPARL